MGGKGSGYRLPLQLTREMKIAFDRLKVQLESADDFPIALKVFRAGLIAYEALGFEGLQSMYRRKLLSDDEVQFMLERGLVREDFRPVSMDRILEAEKIKVKNRLFKDIIECWDGLSTSAKQHHYEQAKRHPDLPNAVKLLKMVKEQTVKGE